MRVENFLIPVAALAGQPINIMSADGYIHHESEPVAYYLVRHGETPWNQKKEMNDLAGNIVTGPLVQGDMDTELNETGVEQALHTVDFLSATGISIDAIYTSPLKRASSTAEIIASKFDLMPIHEQAFASRPWGAAKGKSLSERQKQYAIDSCGNYRGPNWEAMPTKERWSFQPVDRAESTDSVILRMQDAFARISAASESGSSKLVVTHSSNLKSMVLHCNETIVENARLNNDLSTIDKIEKVSFENVGIHKFLYDKRTDRISYCGEVKTPHSDTADSFVTRAIFDVGSSSLKVLVADVDPNIQKILRIHHSEERWIPFKRDMILSGQSFFSQAVQDKAMKAFADLKARLEKYHPAEWVGISTSAARSADNAAEFFEKVNSKLGIQVRVVTASEEGILGFLTAAAAAGLPKEHVISFDSGGASFQLAYETEGKLEVVEGMIAYLTALETLLTEIRGLPKEALESELNGKKITTSPNPVSIDEVKLLLPALQKRLPSLSNSFLEKLKNPNSTVVSIGGPFTAFSYAEHAVGKSTFMKDELWSAIEMHCGKTDSELQEFPYPRQAVLGMIFLYSMMDGLGIEKLTNVPSLGSCEGLAIAESYWTPKKPL